MERIYQSRLKILVGSPFVEQMDRTDLLWALLKAEQFEAIKNLGPEGIDFGRRNCTNGRTLLVQAADLFLPTDKKNKKERLDCVTRLVSWGASPVQTCSKDADYSIYLWKGEKKEGTEIEVDPSGLSAISYVEEWIDKLTYNDSPWGDEIESMGQVLACFVTAFQKEKAGRVSIHEGIAELWEKQLAAKASHDLTFKTADGEVTAHAQMLKDASSVISAMLASPMKEGQAQAIWVKDASSSGVSLFLEILDKYTTGVCTVSFHVVGIKNHQKLNDWILMFFPFFERNRSTPQDIIHLFCADKAGLQHSIAGFGFGTPLASASRGDNPLRFAWGNDH